VLASRSPRRFELLRLLVPADRIRVVPPRTSEEASFAGCTTLAAVAGRLAEIVRAKAGDVQAQLERAPHLAGPASLVIAADTVVVAGDEPDRLVPLGQPAAGDAGRDDVRRWFKEYYAGRTHTVMTGLLIMCGNRQVHESAIRTELRFRADATDLVEWYLGTGEPWGKAGGYAIQGAGSVFVEQVAGSLSNVIGLPLERLQTLFQADRLPAVRSAS